jgi:predicted dehydrogenase
MMMRKFGVGVVGIGDISDVYLNNLKRYDDVIEVIGCASRDAERARLKARDHALRRAYATADDLMADSDVDIVLNLTTPDAHADLNLAALRAGKHIYSEKPLAATFAESQAILNLANANGRYVGCAPDTFLGGRLQTCRKLIDAGELGDIVGATAFCVSHGWEWFHPNPDFFYQPGAGPLLDIGPYYVTALLSLLGPAVSCCAMTNTAFAKRTIQSEPRKGQSIDVEVETHVTGSVEFASGAVATLITSFDVWDSELPRMEIYGTRATVSMNEPDPNDGPNLFGGRILYRDIDSYRWKDMPRIGPRSDWLEVPVEHPFTSTSHGDNSRGIGLVDMAYAIRDGRPARASGEMALHSVELMEGLLVSARERRYLDLTTTFERPTPLPVDFPMSERQRVGQSDGG